MIAAAIGTLVVLRIALGDLTWRDIVAVAAALVVYPFGEWAIHVYLLHMRPFRLGERRIDPPAAKAHRAHHRKPNDLTMILLDPLEVALLLLLAVPATVGTGAVLVGLVAGPVPLGVAVSAAIADYVAIFLYEWTHFLIHTAYRAAVALLPLDLAKPPPAPLQERALLARDHPERLRPRPRHEPGPELGPAFADCPHAHHAGVRPLLGGSRAFLFPRFAETRLA